MTGGTVPVIRRELETAAEPGYREFSRRLTPTRRLILGVRIPVLRTMAVHLQKRDIYTLPVGADSTHEEVLLAGMLLARQPVPTESLFPKIDCFLDSVDNWAACDIFCSELKRVKKELSRFWDWSGPLFSDPREFHVRFAAVLLLTYFVRAEYIARDLERLVSVRHPGRAARMGTAWAFSICEAAFPGQTQNALNAPDLLPEIRKMAIQKIREKKRARSLRQKESAVSR